MCMDVPLACGVGDWKRGRRVLFSLCVAVRPAEAIYPIVFWGMSAQCRGCDVMALEVAMAQADDPCTNSQ